MNDFFLKNIFQVFPVLLKTKGFLWILKVFQVCENLKLVKLNIQNLLINYWSSNIIKYFVLFGLLREYFIKPTRVQILITLPGQIYYSQVEDDMEQQLCHFSFHNTLTSFNFEMLEKSRNNTLYCNCAFVQTEQPYLIFFSLLGNIYTSIQIGKSLVNINCFQMSLILTVNCFEIVLDSVICVSVNQTHWNI